MAGDFRLSGRELQCGVRVLDLSCPAVMGILNVTPDSFSDGGSYNSVDSALRAAEKMMLDGAAIIDVGGESTRPGASFVELNEEMDRVVPVIDAISRNLDVVISVDTSRPEIMKEAARAGAGLINDVRALTLEGALDAVVNLQLPVCLMHMKGEPKTMQKTLGYSNVLLEVLQFLQQRAQVCQEAGISRHSILLDPGLGFGKSLNHNLILLRELEQLVALGYPVLVGVSRKSMIGAVLNRPVEKRLYGGLAIAALAVLKGAKLIRSHDVGETFESIRMVEAIMCGHEE